MNDIIYRWKKANTLAKCMSIIALPIALPILACIGLCVFVKCSVDAAIEIITGVSL